MEKSNNGIWIAVQYFSVLLIMAALVWLLADNLMAVLVIAFCWLFLLPAVVVALVSLFYSLGRNTLHKRILLGLHFVNVVLVCVLWLNPWTKCDADIMEKHYLKYGGQMEELYCKMCDKLKPGCYVDIEFDHGKVSRFHFACAEETADSLHDSGMTVPVYHLYGGLTDIEQNWNPSEEKVDSLLSACWLDRKALKELKRDLKDVGCISIKMRAVPDGPFVLGFRRIVMGLYSYKIFHHPLSVDEQNALNGWEDTEIVFSPYVVFDYSVGAVGQRNFIGKEEYLEKKRQRFISSPQFRQ